MNFFKHCLSLFTFLFFLLSSRSQSTFPLDSLRRAAASGTDSLRAAALLSITDHYLFEKTDSATFFVLQAKAIAERTTGKRQLIACYNNLGIIYGMQSDFDKSLSFFLKELPLQEALHDEKGTAGTLSNIARIYVAQKNYEAALAVLNRARQLDEKLNNEDALADDNQNIGIVEKNRGNLTEAHAYYRLALAHYYKIKDTVDAATVLNNIALLLQNQQQYEASADSAGKALMLFTLKHHRTGMTYSMLHMGTDYYKLKQYDKALGYLLPGQALARQLHLLSQQQHAYKMLAAVYREQADYKEAGLYLDSVIITQDSLYDQEKSKLLSDLTVRYNTENKQLRIEALEKEAALQKKLRYLYITVSLLAVIVLAVVSWNIHKRNKLLTSEKAAVKLSLELEKEKEQLRVQQQLQEEKKQSLEVERLKQEQVGIKLEKERLALELDENQRAMLTNMIQLQQQKEMLEKFEASLQQLQTAGNDQKLKASVSLLSKEIQQQRDLTDDWEQIKFHFDKVHPDFFNRLKDAHPGLTVTELKICAYTKMKLNGKEMGRMLNVNPNSIQVARYRLKKKMKLDEDINFTTYIIENY